MSGQQKFYITTAISYPNGPPHIGHAYEAIATDAIARFERLDGKDVFFLTGTDEHGLKMKQTAVKEGLAPRALADRNSAALPRHGRGARPLQRRLHPHHRGAALPLVGGDLAAHGAGPQRRHLPQEVRRLVLRARRGLLRRGARPRSAPDGVRLGPQGTPVEWFEEDTFFFRLSAYQDKLLEHYEKHPDFILPRERRNEVVSFVKGGLEDLSVSRTTLDWGIKVPGAPEHVMYVWVDALTNYITGAGFPDENSPRWRYWPADVHVIGKDIVRFHAVYWPAFLMSAGIELPKRVFAHGFLYNRGEKMSKSVGNVVDPFDLVAAYGVDQVRYFFLREVVFGQDGIYSPEAIANRINADLANDLGNLAQRSLSMIDKNCGGKIPRAGRLHARRTRRSWPRPTRSTARRARPWTGRASSTTSTPSGGGGGCQPLLRGRGAVGQAQDRLQAHGDDPLRDGGGGAAGGDPGPAGDAGGRGQAARRPGAVARRRAASRRWARPGGCKAGHRHPAAGGRLPALRRAGDRDRRAEAEEAKDRQRSRDRYSLSPFLRGEG